MNEVPGQAAETVILPGIFMLWLLRIERVETGFLLQESHGKIAVCKNRAER
jgi:hypothetical protein